MMNYFLIDNHYRFYYHLEMIICVCKSVSDREIKATIETGVTSLEGLQCSLGVATQCGSCSCDVKEILQKAQGKKSKQRKVFTPQQATLPFAAV